jgi:GR25 family glycosyltransferase involved in LPS biosynthesis|tara:strand:- start:3252 stop:3944 length:693 start_codon:yes stop_codon:yes gene_type:complete
MKIKFYVMHYKKNVERRIRLEGILNSLDIEADWYTKYDKDELTEEQVEHYYRPDLELFKTRTASMYEEIDYNNYSGTTRGHLSLAIKYIKCMEDFVSSDYDVAVFLEDDITFNALGEAKKDIVSSINTANEVNWDGIFFGGGFDHGLIEKRIVATYKNLLLVDHPATNCTSSFGLTKRGVKKILGTFNEICTSIDWELNYHFKVNNLKIWHTNPYICGQLSTSGVFECTL